RDLDMVAVRELYSAFGGNPAAARRKYAGVRWRFVARVDDFNGSDSVTVVIESGGVGQARVETRTEGEVEKLRRGAHAVFEATGERLDQTRGADFKFGDAVVVGAVEPPQPIGGVGELTAQTADQLAREYNQNPSWATTKYSRTRWRFRGL